MLVDSRERIQGVPRGLGPERGRKAARRRQKIAELEGGQEAEIT